MAQSPPVVQQPSETQPGERVNTFGAAQILGCSTSKVRKLVAAGKLPKPSIVEPGHTRMHSRSALDAYSAEADGPEAAHAGAGAEPVGM
jgi:excisionase family DNA binding protein